MSMSVRGLASGLDVDSIVNQLIALEQKPITLLQQKQLKIEAQQGAWRDVNSRLKNLSDKLSPFKLSSTFTTKSATSSSQVVLTASASASAAAGSYDITVSDLATYSSAHSTATTITDSTVGLQAAGSIEIVSPTGSIEAKQKWKVDVTAQDSLNAVVDKINKLTQAEDGSTNSAPVVASIINNQLVLTSKSSGATSAFAVNVTGDLASKLGAMTTINGHDSAVSINGMNITSASNSLSAIPGVTVNLLSNGSSKLTVAQDTGTAIKAAQDFVDQYNSVMDFINDKLDKDKGDLRGDSTLMGLQSALRSMVASQASYSQGKYRTMADIGISTGKWDPAAPDYSGKLTLDTSKLTAALQDDPLAVKAILFNETNIASNSKGATASGASYDNTNYPVSSVIDGSTDSTLWGNGQGWNSASPVSSTAPGILTVNFSGVKTLEKIKLFTLDSLNYPAKNYGVKSYDLYYFDTNHERKKIASISDNQQGQVISYVDSIKATGLEFDFTASNDNSYARVVEVEAYENSGVMNNLDQYINQFIRSGDGILASKDKSYQGQIDDIKDQTQRMTDRLDQRKQTLINQFTAMEKAISTMKSQGDALASQLSGLTSQQQ